MRTNFIIRDILENALKDVGKNMGGMDAACIAGPLIPPVENVVRDAVEKGKDGRKTKIAIVLDTPGGVAEVVDRMVKTIRHAYKEVAFIVPDAAMSAGTMLAMSGDRILMDYHSCLGPIDAQVEKGGKLLSTVGYLRQFEQMKERSREGTLTEADVILLHKMDLGELEEYEQEGKLAVELLTDWLSRYKFKNWKKTETKQIKVTPSLRRKRATEIAEKLGDYDRWHTHGRPIDIHALRTMNLRIENYSEKRELNDNIKFYFSLLQDFMMQEKIGGLVQLGNFYQGLS